MNTEKLQEHIQDFFKKIKANPSKCDSDKKERDALITYYQTFSKEKILKMTSEDIYEYLSKLWAMLIWGNKHYVINKLIEDNGIENLRKRIADLVWGEAAIEKRWDTFRSEIKGMGPAMISEILCKTHPNKYILWNRRAYIGLNYLEVKNLPRYDYQLTGKIYKYLCDTVQNIASEFKKHGFADESLLAVDYFIWDELQVEDNLNKIHAKKVSPEKQTRALRIDKKLEQSGWKIVKYEDGKELSHYNNCAIEEYPTAKGPADYALVYNDKIIGIVEGKKLKVNPENVLDQAKRYSRGLPNKINWHGYKAPFLYSTNGELIFFLDVRVEKNVRREISNFHTSECLDEMLNKNVTECLHWLYHCPLELERLRPYQSKAIKAIENAISIGKQKIFVAMATGTGKTFMTVSLIYHLLKSGLFQRVLFLVDRKALAAQAVTAFSSFDTSSGLKFDQEYEVYSQKFRKEDFEGLPIFERQGGLRKAKIIFDDRLLPLVEEINYLMVA